MVQNAEEHVSKMFSKFQPETVFNFHIKTKETNSCSKNDNTIITHRLLNKHMFSVVTEANVGHICGFRPRKRTTIQMKAVSFSSETSGKTCFCILFLFWCAGCIFTPSFTPAFSLLNYTHTHTQHAHTHTRTQCSVCLASRSAQQGGINRMADMRMEPNLAHTHGVWPCCPDCVCVYMCVYCWKQHCT